MFVILKDYIVNSQSIKEIAISSAVNVAIERVK